MKHIKRFIKVLALVMALSVLSPSIVPLSSLATAEAATVKLNKKTLTLEVGKSATLKITGTKAKVTWSSSNKAIATVSTKGKVTAKKAGKATITATVNKKKYTCTVTVKKAAVQDSTKAPFTPKEAKLGKIKYLYPKDWTNYVLFEDEDQLMAVTYSGNDMATVTSSISIIVIESGMTNPSVSEVEEFVDSTYTPEYLTEQYGIDTSIANFKINEYKAKAGVAFMFEFESLVADMVMKQSFYALFIDKYMVMIAPVAVGDSENKKIREIAEYMVNNITVEK